MFRKNSIRIIVIGFPIISIFLIAIVSQQVTLAYAQKYIDSHQNYMFQQQIDHNLSIMQIVTFQIQQELQKFPYYLNLANNFLFSQINDKVMLDNKAQQSLIHTEKLYQNAVDNQDVISIFKKNPLWINTWYHKNITSIKDLSNQGQILLHNTSYQNVILRPIQFQSSKQVNLQRRQIQIKDYFQGFNYQGFFISGGVNTTFASFPENTNCGKGFYSYDPRCRFWYVDTQNEQSVKFNQPRLVYTSDNPKLESPQCQRLKVYNQTTNQIDLYNVLCITILFNDLNNYFNNINNVTSHVYYIDTQSQTVIFNSQNENQSNEIINLSDVESQYQSKEDLKILEQQIKKMQSNYQYKQLDWVPIEKIQSIKQNQMVFETKRNGEKIKVAINPITIYDKAPKYLGDKKFDGKRFQIQVPYLQINFLNDSIYKEQAQEFQDFFKSYFLFVTIFIGVFCVISFIITLIYLRKIQHMIYQSIEQLISLLMNINQADKKWDIFNFESSNIFLSKDISDLYDSLKQIHLYLTQTSEKFFESNQSEILLKLTRNIEFFKKFDNLNALGIAYNNIGYILLSQDHYMQALESFQQSIIYAKYEIQQFIKQNPSSQYVQILESVTFNDDRAKSVIKDQKSQKISGELQERSIGLSLNENMHDKKASIKNQLKNKLSSQTQNERSQQITITPSQASPFLAKNQEQRQQLRTMQDGYTDQNFTNNNQADDHFQHVDKLLQTLHQRKKNYVYTLLQFQENLSKNQKSGLKYNFWKEIYIIIKELNSFPQVSNLYEKNKIVMSGLQAKCQYYLQNFQKAESIVLKCEEEIKKYKKQQQGINQTQKERQFNSQDQFGYRQDINNIPPFFSRQSIDLEYQNSKKKSTIIEQSNILNSKNVSSNQLNLIVQDEEFNSISSFATKIYLPSQSHFQKKIFSLNQSSSILNKADYRDQQSKIMQKKTTTKKLELLEGDVTDLYPQDSDDLEQNLDRNKSTFRYFINVQKINKSRNSFQCNLNSKIQNVFLLNTTTQYPQSNNNSKQIDTQNTPSKIKKEVKISINQSKEKKQENTFVDNNDIESLFSLLRKYEKAQEDEAQVNKFISIENIHCMLSYVKAEFYFYQQKYLESGLILTDLFEVKQNFMSQIRYKITFLLKQVLDKLQINSEEFKQFYCKFNPNITTQIVIIYNQPLCLKQILETTQLLSNLVSTTFTNEKDQLELIISDKETQSMKTYLSLIKINKVRNTIKQIISDIIQQLVGQNFTKEQLIEAIQQIMQNSFKQKTLTYLDYPKSMISNNNYNDLLNGQHQQLLKKHSQQIAREKQQQKQGQEQNQNQSYLNLGDIIQYYQEKQNSLNLPNNTKILKQFIEKYIEEDIDQSNFNCTNQPNDSYNPSLKKINNYTFSRDNKQEINQKDYCNVQNKYANTQEYYSKQITYGKQLALTKNQYFHTSIKKAISDLLLQNSFSCYSQFNASQTQKLQTDKYTQQFIIFSTDEVCISNDTQFQSLCEILRKYYIQLIIYSNNKGENFLECLENQILVYQGIEIIRVLYSNQDIYCYLKNSRDTFHKYIYPIFIQHF